MASLEICCFNSDSALNAGDAGAARIELCGDAFPGGSTPSFYDFSLLQLNGKMTIPMYIMIRPRGGNFIYSNEEFQEMKNYIHQFKMTDTRAKADGFVFGILDGDNRVDVERNKELVELAKPLPCTFHRAFDEIPSQEMGQALEDVIRCGFSNILTSGGKKTAIDGVEILKRLTEQADDRINIMPGGGVRSENAGFLVEKTGAKWLHSSVLVGEGNVATRDEIRKLLQVLQC